MDLRPPEFLKPWIDLAPPGGREFLNSGGWLLVAAILLLILLFLLFRSVRGLLRHLFGGRRKGTLESDRDFLEDLSDAPLPTGEPGDRRLTVYHVPVRMRLVVVAPLGREMEVNASAVEKTLDQIVPG